MGKQTLQLPVRIAGLIIGYVNDSLTELEKDELDEWVVDKDQNAEIFASLLDWERYKPISPDKYLNKYEEMMEMWIVSGWLAKRDLNELSAYETEQLTSWILTSPEKIEQLQQLKSYHNKEWLAKRILLDRRS